MANSWLNAAYRFGFELRLACPEGYRPDPQILERARSRTDILLTADPREAAAGAEVINTDVWTSMGQEAETQARLKAFAGYHVDDALMAGAAEQAIFLHCLPAHRGEEVADSVIEGAHSRVFDEAENRLHVQKAIMASLLAGNMEARMSESLKRTPLYEEHRRAGGKIVPFAGWEMAVQYPGGIVAEHHKVRTAAGLFDVCHMGELEIRGPQALALVQHVTTNDASKLEVGQAQYSVFCYEDGGAVDDCIVYRFPDHYMIVVNASNADKDRDWIRALRASLRCASSSIVPTRPA